MKGVVLAAGDGGRLRPLTLWTPKVLLTVGGRPLIHYALTALREAGIRDLVVVVGYQAQKVVEALEGPFPEVEFAYNPFYHGGNALSVYAARDYVEGEPFVVCMGDHPISPQIVATLMEEPLEGCVLCVDRRAHLSVQLDDATRVLTDPGGYIIAIGKGLAHWNAVDTGVFRFTDAVFPAIEHLRETKGGAVTLTDVVRYMGDTGRPLATCDVSGAFWADVDTLEDYESIDALLREGYGERV